MTGGRAGAEVPDRPLAVLLGLPPAHVLGLARALRAHDLDVVAVADAGGLAALLARQRAVVVLPSERLADLPAGHEEAAVPVLLVPDGAPDRWAEALALGAAGVADAAATAEEVAEVVVAALRGRVLLPGRVARALAVRTGGAPGEALPLSEREVGWLRGLADSTTVTSLARGNGYSEREMYRLLHDVYARIGAGSRTEALLIAQRHGLLGPAAEADAASGDGT